MRKKLKNLDPTKLTINVVGTCNSGKSAIIDLINDTLKNNGFNTEVNNLDETMYPIDREQRLRAIITKNKKISINEVQAVLDLKEND